MRSISDAALFLACLAVLMLAWAWHEARRLAHGEPVPPYTVTGRRDGCMMAPQFGDWDDMR